MDNKHIVVFSRNWLIAASSVVIARTLTAPFERVKIILQTQTISPQVDIIGAKRYKGFFDCMMRLYKEDGFMTFWRGNGINLMRQLPSSSFTFAFNDLFKEIIVFKNKEVKMPFWKRLSKHMLCGALAGVATMTIMQPVSLCQTLVTADLGTVPAERIFSGPSDCFRAVYLKGGVRSFYTGFVCGVLGMSMYRSVYFGLFATFKHYFEVYSGSRPAFYIAWPVAQVITLLASMISYPFDTISRSQQILSLSSSTYRSTGPLRTTKEIIRAGGLSGIYSGVGVNALRTIGGTLIIVAYDEMQYRFFTPDKAKSFVVLAHHQMEDTIRKSYGPRR